MIQSKPVFVFETPNKSHENLSKEFTYFLQKKEILTNRSEQKFWPFLNKKDR